MTLLLAPDAVDLYPAGSLDAHGWREQGTDPTWTGWGNLQLGPGRSDPRAADSGGHGPSDPAAVEDGVLYLPSEAPVVEGCGAMIRGRMFLLANVRLIPDPTYPAGGLTCYASTASGVANWPAEVGP